jgi:glycerophosphoryl diester phosphodiesterase
MSTGPILVETSDTLSPMTHPYISTDKPIAFAHRGGASDEPENSMPAFQRAIDLGYRYIETDVHSTRDGVLIAFHDDDLLRTCGKPGVISEMNYEQVREYRINGKEHIPLLQEILDAWPQAMVNIDCKADTAVEPLSTILKNAGVLERVCVGSFSDKRLSVLREAFGPALCTSLGPREVAKLRVRSWVGPVRSFPGAFAAQVPFKQGPLTITDKKFVDEAHDSGLHVHVWTIDNPHEMNELFDLGVDGIMTDKPQVLKDVMISRGIW